VAEDHPPHHVAVSFAIGIFVTALPSLGTGLVVLAWVGYQFAWANKVALGAAIAVLNPLAKSSFYAASFVTGTALLGPRSPAPTWDSTPERTCSRDCSSATPFSPSS